MKADTAYDPGKARKRGRGRDPSRARAAGRGVDEVVYVVRSRATGLVSRELESFVGSVLP